MDSIALFRIFSRVVETASFTRAAETLGVPRSSVSAAVMELENKLGARFLHRTTRKVTPTQDGLALYERCQTILAEVEATHTLFRDASAPPTGKLRVNLPGRLGRCIVAPALPHFLDAFPGIDLDLGVTDRAIDLVESGVDCVVRVGPLSTSGLIAHRLGEISLINVASPTYLARHGIPHTPQDLPQHWAVHYASPTSGRVEEWEWIENGLVHTLPLRARVSVNSAEASIACARAGLGLIQIPAYDVRHHLAAGELTEVLPDHRAPPLPVTLLFPHRPALSHRVRVFTQWLEELLRRCVLD